MLESPFNDFLGKEMASAERPETLLTQRLEEIKKRSLELNAAREKMKKGYEQVLQGLADAFPNLKLSDPNLRDTPNRMARALLEVCSGLGMKDQEVITTTFPLEKYNEVVILKNINFNSLCSHHFFPFTGVAHVGYLPEMGEDGAVVGLSKLARIVDSHARRPQLQERLCYSIMEALKSQLKPAGIMVVMEASHGCLTCRGAMKTNALMVTSALDGKFKTDDKLRKEFLNLIKVQ